MHRISRGIMLAFLVLLVLTCTHLSLAEEELASAEEELIYSRVIDVPGVGELMYYAQNDPTWALMGYSKPSADRHPIMKASGCGPTSAAMAVARQLADSELRILAEHARDPERGFPVCECSVGWGKHSGEHEVITPQTDEEYAAYLPVVIGSYSAGNNESRMWYCAESGATNVGFFKDLAAAYGLQYRGTHDWDEMVAALADGYSVVTAVAKSPFTSRSHFMFIASVTDGYIYILDPLMREEYPEDKRHVIEIVEPGLLRLSEEDRRRAGLTTYYMMKRAE